MHDATDAEFQPLLDITTARITAIELRHRPCAVLEHTESSVTHGLRHPMISVEMAVHAFEALERHGHSHVSVCFTVSWQWITNSRIVKDAMRMLCDSSMPPRNLILLISDETALVDHKTAIRNIHKLRRYGVDVCLSNFGSAIHTSDYLCCLPIDTVRFDPSILANRHENWRGSIILESVIDMAHRMHIKVLVDGVNSKDDIDFASKAKADVVQGDFVAPPARMSALPSWLNTRNRLTASAAFRSSVS